MRLTSFRRLIPAVAVLATFCAWQTAAAHFIWLAPSADVADGGAETLEIYFSESASPDNPELLDRLGALQLWAIGGDGRAESLQPSRSGDSLAVMLPQGASSEQLFVAAQDFGPRDKGGAKFRLKYYAKAGPSLQSPLWQQVDARRYLALDIVPRPAGDKVELTVTFNGSPAADAQVRILGPDDSDGEDFEGQTDADGRYTFTLTEAGRYSIRARHIEAVAGKVGDAEYDDTRHYVTLTLDVPAGAKDLEVKQIGELPTTLTSFGGAVIDDTVYIFGGTTGESHAYSADVQNDELMRMKLDEGKWETVARGPRLQGLAMVPHGGNLYRIGGFEARNDAGEEHDLWSVASVSRFDPGKRQWTDLPSLPEARSSFDAAVLGDTIYVIGGWAMSGDARSVWHETAWKLDLSQDVLTWTRIADPPVERRALAVAAHDGRIYAIGGMTSGGETTLETDVYDPESDSWTEGPELVGDSGMAGFGASAFAVGGRLYVTTVSGTLQRLSEDGKSWEVVAKTPTPRFFHRMLPAGEDRLVMVGGSNREGRVTEVEVIKVPQN